MTCRAIFVSLLLVLAQASHADDLTGRVVGVIDGDTVDVLVAGHDSYRIRISGIDAPEKAQPFGQASKRRMSDLVYGKEAAVEYSKRDRYGRIIGIVRVAGIDAGLELIKSGLAWHYKQYQKEQSPEDRTAYSSAETTARQAGVGLWSEPDPTPPWDWRRRR